MKKRFFVMIGILTVLLGAAASGYPSDQKAASEVKTSEGQKPAASVDRMVLLIKDPLTTTTATVPLFSTVAAGRPVAVVNNDEITVEDLRDSIVDTHQQNSKEKDNVVQARKIMFDELLNRLINVRLIVQEAKNIGLDELPEIKQGIDVFSKITLRNLLREELWKDLTVNEDEVEKVYRADVNQVKVTLVVFTKKQEAKKALGKIKVKDGKNFDEVVAQEIKDGKTIAKEAGAFFKMNQLDPAIAEQIPKMKIGEISPVIKVKKKGKMVFEFFRLDEQQTFDSAAAKEAARNKVLLEEKVDIINKFLPSLYKTGVKTNDKLKDSLDYGPKGAGIEKLMEDKRVLAEIEGEDPVTVGELSEALLDKFYHGIKNLNSQKLAKAKNDAFETIMEKRLLHREAIKRGIDRSEAYTRMLAEYKRSTLFSVFVQKVIVPDIQTNTDELKAYYHDHADEYMSSEMVKLRTLAFRKKDAAAAVIDKMKKGADFDWVKANAEGLVEKNEDDPLSFEEDQYVTTQALPEDIQKAIARPRAGDFRLYEGPEGTYYVLNIQEVIPAKPRPFEEVREPIREIVYGKRLNKSVEEWAQKLKESSDVKIYFAGFEER